MVSFLMENDDDDDERFSLCRRRMWKNPSPKRDAADVVNEQIEI